MEHRILLAEPKSCNPTALSIFQQCGTVDIEECARPRLMAIIPKYDVLVIRLRHHVDQEILQRAKRLKFIVSATTGLDHIDLDAAAAGGIHVLSLKGETEFLSEVSATAEHTWGLLLALIRRIPEAFNSVLAGTWNREQHFGTQLRQKTIGIIGYGRLGKMIARYAKAFDMKILLHDPYVDPPESDSVRKVDLSDLLRSSDIVSIHVPLTEETRGLIGKREFSGMKSGAVLINTARGDIVSDEALLEALQNRHLAGAALDVLSGETSSDPHWIANHPLHAYASAHSNLLLTPHLGGATFESVAQTEIFMAEKLKFFLQSLKSANKLYA